jgi:CRP-like cAMP-binding protein
MGLVETMSLTAVATLLHELRMEVAPKGYRLKIRVEPLPGPDAKFGVRVAARREAGDRAVTPRPAGEDRVLAQFPGAEDPEVQRLLGCATRVVVGPREVIVREGDAADALFIVLRGEAHVSRTTGKAEDSQFLARLGEGQFFGEIGLLQNAPRNATVRSGPHGATLLRVDRKTVDALLAANDFVLEEIVRLLRKRLAADHLLEALPELKAGGAARWLPEFESRTVPAGTVFVREGESASEFFVITEGEVVVEQETNGTVRERARLCAGEYFGEIGLLRGTPRTATVRAVSPEVTVLVLDAVGFRRLVGEQGGSRGDLALALYRRIS